MKTTVINQLVRVSAVALATGALALAGCTQQDRDEAKVNTDRAVADVKQTGSELATDAKRAGSEMKADIKDATAGARVAVADATITTSVKAELAKDDVLKARDINVDTEGGRVSLRGTAPTTEAKERAKSLASGVSGVVSVDNQLTVSSS